VVVLVNGSAVAVNWADEHVQAILEAWYPGEEGGTAIADVLFGDYNPGGRLPVTFYRSVDQLPDFEDYRMGGRTYRFFTGEPLYPFGYGLSYTTFAYRKPQITPSVARIGQAVAVQVTVENIGDRAGDEVVQLYVRDVEASSRVPSRSLQGFTRIHLRPGERQVVSFDLTPEQMALVDETGHKVVEPGIIEVSVGGGQPGTGAPVAMGVLELTA
jgi:beta-glucosidase